MAAYLQRLLDTAAPIRADPPGLAPVVRSSSPVFEQNQLIALEETAAGPSADPVGPPALDSSAPWLDPPPHAFDAGGPSLNPAPPAFDPGAPRLDPPPAAFNAGGPSLNPAAPAFDPGAPRLDPAPPASSPPGEMPETPPIAASPAASAPAVPADHPPFAAAVRDVSFAEAQAPAAPPAVEIELPRQPRARQERCPAPIEPPAVEIELTRQPPARHDPPPAPVEPPPLTPSFPPAAADEQAEAAPLVRPSSPPAPAAVLFEPTDAGRRDEAPRRQSVRPEQPQPRILPPKTEDVRAIGAPAVPDPGPKQPRSSLSPRPPPDPVPADPPYQAPAAPAEPTITIGQVTVEIVDDSRPGSAAPQPLTAASASMIGPLGQARAARQLIALRRL